MGTLDSSDIIDTEEQEARQHQVRQLNVTSRALTDYELIINEGANYWQSLASHNLKAASLNDIRVSIPMQCAKMVGGRAVLSERQMKAAFRIKSEAEADGFEFVSCEP